MDSKTRLIHPDAMIGERVELGHGVVIGPNVVIEDDVSIGAYSVIGGSPEFRDFGPDWETSGIRICGFARIFEFVTIHSGIKRQTKIDVGAMIFNHSHIAHDCYVGPAAVVGGQASLAGHTTLFRSATVSGKSCTHQFAVLGAYSFLGAMSYLKGNIPPGHMAMGNPARLAGMNEVGIARAELNNFTVQSMFTEEFNREIEGNKR